MKKALCVALVAAIAMPAFAQIFHNSTRVTGADNQVFITDNAGLLTGQYSQIAGAAQDAWGYRDGMTDGTYVYFGWGGGVARHNADGSGGILQIGGAAPGGVGTWRALAYDPTGNSGAGSIWTASFGSVLIETDMSGTLLNSFPSVASLYGLSYDDTDGNLWGHDGGGDILKIDSTTGALMPGIGWTAGPWTAIAAQGGLSGFSELGGNLAAIAQGTPDELGVYDTAASQAGG
ncbi:hypothetical protein LCGC14_0908450, partial [marine sediment metagenome]